MGFCFWSFFFVELLGERKEWEFWEENQQPLQNKLRGKEEEEEEGEEGEKEEEKWGLEMLGFRKGARFSCCRRALDSRYSGPPSV